MTLPRLGTTDDVAALEEIVALSWFEAVTLEVANIRLARIFQLASDRLKGDDPDPYAEEDPRVRNSPLRGALDYYRGKYA